MRNTLLLVLCLFSSAATAELRKRPQDSSVRVALAPPPTMQEKLPSDSPESDSCTAAMDTQSLQDLVRSEARRGGLDEKLALAILDQESSNGAHVNSPKGARGPMMLMPQTAAEYGVKDICNPAENVRGSMLFLKDLTRQFEGNMMLVAAAYNAGAERVIAAKGIPANSETVRYVAAVTNHYYGLGELSGRRERRGLRRGGAALDVPEGGASPAEKSRAASDQGWIGGSVLYVPPDKEGDSE